MNKFKNKKVAVLGLGIEGKDAINYLISVEAQITLFDKKSENELDFSGLDKNKIGVISGKNYLKSNFEGFDYIIRSPGVYRFLPEIVKAEKNGVEITSAIKIFFDESPAMIIGVTGTKGKGTTSTLIDDILKADGKDVYLSGNIGKPYLELLPKLTKDSWVVMEMSSFQLIDMDVSPHIAVVLNITTDHLDWHVNREEYVDSKRNIVSHQSSNDFAVINEEYETSKGFANDTKAKIIFFSKERLDEKYKKDLLLRGEHNLENIAAAVSVAEIVGVSEKIILETVRSFKGLEHRLELVKAVDGVTFYNDSFATGPQPTIAAINSFTEPETLILGGSDKGLDYSELGKEISKRTNIKNIILIGTTGPMIQKYISQSSQFVVHNLRFASMKEVVAKAFGVTQKGGVVILSPASASFDMFKNYKDRGNQFKQAVQQIDEKEN